MFTAPPAKKLATSEPFGSGHVLGSSSQPASSSHYISPNERLRNVWATKFNNATANGPSTSSASVPQTNILNTPTASAVTTTNSPAFTPSKSTWKELDGDLLIQEVEHVVINISDNESDVEETNEDQHVQDEPEFVANPKLKPKSELNIKQELIEDLDEDENDIELIDDEYDDNLHNESIEVLTDTSVIDDIFGTDTLMSDFNTINDVIMNDPENIGDPNKEIITCPICQEQMPREELSEHLDGCTGIIVKVERKRKGSNVKKPNLGLPFYKNKPTTSTSSNPLHSLSPIEINALRASGYSESDLDRLKKDKIEEKAYNERILNEMAAENRNRNQNAPNEEDSMDAPVENQLIACPNCHKHVDAVCINDHLDVCLETNATSMATADEQPDVNGQAPPFVKCPVCNQETPENEINDHIDICLGSADS